METWIQVLWGGIFIGALYGLVALGLSVVYGVLDILHFSHGAIAILSAYLTIDLRERTGSLALALLGGAAAIVVLELVLYFGVLSRLRGAHINGLIASVGIIQIIETVVLRTWGGDPKRLPARLSGYITIGGARLPRFEILAVGLTAVFVVLLTIFLYRTRAGLALRATAQDRRGAEAQGINSKALIGLAFVWAGVAATIAATFIAAHFSVTPTTGETYIMFAFVAILLGGMDNVFGALLGGIIIGCAQSVGSYLVASSWGPIYPLTLGLLVLLWRPQGLFGRPQGASL